MTKCISAIKSQKNPGYLHARRDVETNRKPGGREQANTAILQETPPPHPRKIRTVLLTWLAADCNISGSIFGAAALAGFDFPPETAAPPAPPPPPPFPLPNRASPWSRSDSRPTRTAKPARRKGGSSGRWHCLTLEITKGPHRHNPSRNAIPVTCSADRGWFAAVGPHRLQTAGRGGCFHGLHERRQEQISGTMIPFQGCTVEGDGPIQRGVQQRFRHV